MIGREAAKVIGLHHPLTRSRAVAVEKTSLSLSVPLSERFFVYMFHVSRCKHTGSELHDDLSNKGKLAPPLKFTINTRPTI